MTFSVKPLEPFGCEVDLDIRSRSAADEDHLRKLLARQHLVVFRNQSLTHDEQAEFMAVFGSVLPGEEGKGVIINDPSPDNTLGDGPLGFHSDLSFCPKPYGVMSLLAVQVEDGRSSTQFTDTARVAASLPPDLREKARAAQARQVISYDLAGPNRDHPDPNAMSHVHPAIRAHPQTGEDVIMVSLNQTAEIVNMERAEGDALIDALCNRLYDPSQIYEHVWHRGDMVLFDNQALQHARGPVSDVGTRCLQRVVVAEAGLFEQFPGRTITTQAGSKAGFEGNLGANG